MLLFDNFLSLASSKHLAGRYSIFNVLVQLVAFVVHCESRRPGLRCTGTGSHIVSQVGPSSSQ